MKKPEDYSTYFNEDGTKKKNPYQDEEGFSKKGQELEWRKWLGRLCEIHYSLMTPEEQKRWDEAKAHMRAKMNS